jgi:hypothetical protein
MNERLYVIAGNYRQAVEFARQRGVRPFDLRYIDRKELLAGLDGIVVNLVGTFWEQPVELLSYIDMLERMKRIEVRE